MRGEERREREREQRAPAAIALSIDDSLFAHFFLRLLSPVHFEAPLHGQHDLVDGPPGRLEDGIETVKGVVRGARHGESVSSPAPARRRVFFFFFVSPLSFPFARPIKEKEDEEVSSSACETLLPRGQESPPPMLRGNHENRQRAPRAESREKRQQANWAKCPSLEH